MRSCHPVAVASCRSGPTLPNGQGGVWSASFNSKAWTASALPQPRFVGVRRRYAMVASSCGGSGAHDPDPREMVRERPWRARRRAPPQSARRTPAGGATSVPSLGRTEAPPTATAPAAADMRCRSGGHRGRRADVAIHCAGESRAVRLARRGGTATSTNQPGRARTAAAAIGPDARRFDLHGTGATGDAWRRPPGLERSAEPTAACDPERRRPAAVPGSQPILARPIASLDAAPGHPIRLHRDRAEMSSGNAAAYHAPPRSLAKTDSSRRRYPVQAPVWGGGDGGRAAAHLCGILPNGAPLSGVSSFHGKASSAVRNRLPKSNTSRVNFGAEPRNRRRSPGSEPMPPCDVREPTDTCLQRFSVVD